MCCDGKALLRGSRGSVTTARHARDSNSSNLKELAGCQAWGGKRDDNEQMGREGAISSQNDEGLPSFEAHPQKV